MSRLNFRANSCLELSSDHSPVIITVSNEVQSTERPCRLHSNITDWDYFREQVRESLNNKMRLKTEDDVMLAAEHFNYYTQQTAWNATPPTNNINVPIKCSKFIRQNTRKKESPKTMADLPITFVKD